ncbi:glucose 1-dehydrogenase [Sphingobacterium sp.]|uniref:SDR family NAD(P)-dependent oxidoreductase n=1 Tax=Sphingobacterium sp. TaxID=341027 RepID=UPI00289B4D0C|nr:glucose 1-dehydrogenase [Sphingobacterium sp.]
MKNKTILITGAGSGMGEATAKMFASKGAKVVVADINEANARSVTDSITAAGGQAFAIRCDVADEQQVKQMVEKTVEVYGSLDAAFNNAGIIKPSIDTAELESADFDQVININLKGVWLCMKYELLQMRRQGSGTIVNSSSIAGLAGAPGRTAYAAAKHAIVGMTKSVGAEYAARGIRVNAVCPGTIDTPMVHDMLKTGDLDEQEAIKLMPINRLAKADEVASTVLWLCSEESSFIVGQAIAVDGGFTSI